MKTVIWLRFHNRAVQLQNNWFMAWEHPILVKEIGLFFTSFINMIFTLDCPCFMSFSQWSTLKMLLSSLSVEQKIKLEYFSWMSPSLVWIVILHILWKNAECTTFYQISVKEYSCILTRNGNYLKPRFSNVWTRVYGVMSGRGSCISTKKIVLVSLCWDVT